MVRWTPLTSGWIRKVNLPGTEVTIVWGEEDAGRKPTSEPHVQTRIRATVAPVPYGEVARTAYRPKA